MSESDSEFLDRMSGEVYPGFDGWRTVNMRQADLARIFSLARKGAEAADRIEALEEANELMLTDIRRTDVDMLAFKARIEALEAALRDVLSWHDYADDMHKPIEVRAAYMRARAALDYRKLSLDKMEEKA